MVKFLRRQEAAAIEGALQNEYKFSEDQLLELAGLGCAQAINKCYPHNKNVLMCCGPGNSGGYGFVCARHLNNFGYRTTIFYSSSFDIQLEHDKLKHQCASLSIPFIDVTPTSDDLDSYELIVDGMHSLFRQPVHPSIALLMESLRKTVTPICSIDVPSGWDIDSGPQEESTFHPNMLISVTAPKMCAKYFKGRFHFLSSRYVPPQLAEKYKLNTPVYRGTENIVQLR